jgi:hypothetical protein
MTQQERRPSPWLEILLGMISLAGTCLIIWGNLPPQERQWIRLATASRLHRLLAVRAWREGRAGMRDELAGRDPQPRYAAAAWLGRWRDRLEQQP